MRLFLHQLSVIHAFSFLTLVITTSANTFLLCPSAQFVVIPDAGHMATLENPTAFNAALQRFLKQV